MAILYLIVLPTPHFLAFDIPKIAHCSFVRGQAIRGDFIARAMALERLSHEAQSSLLIAGLGDIAFEDFSFLVHRTPKVVRLTIDLNEHLIEMPLPLAKVESGRT